MHLRWGAQRRRSQTRAIVMAQRGRGHRRARRSKNENEVNEPTEMMRTMMTKMDVVEATHRIGIAHVVRDISDDEEETEREEEEEQVTVEERMFKAISNIGGKPRLILLSILEI